MKNCGHKKADDPAGSWRSEKIPTAAHLSDCFGGYPRVYHHSAVATLLFRASRSFAVCRRLADLDLRGLPTRLRPHYRQPVRPHGAKTTVDCQPGGNAHRISDTLPGYFALGHLSLPNHRWCDGGKSIVSAGL